MIKIYNYLGAVILAATISCSGSDNGAVDEKMEKVDLDQLEYTKLSKQLITNVIECTGSIDVPPNQRAALFAPIGGNISDIRVLPGDKVKKGQTLYKLSHQDLVKVQEEYLVAYNEEELHRINLERKQQLFETENVSERQLREAKRDFEIARANLSSLKAQLEIIGISVNGLVTNGIRPVLTVKAPIDGYISKIEAMSGAYVNMNSRIMTIVNTEHKHVELDVYADNISNVRNEQLVGFHIAGEEKEFRAHIYLIGKEVDEETRTVSVHAHMDHDSADELIVGTYLYAGIMIESDSVLSIPESALINVEGKKYVMVKEGDALKSVEVEVGNSFKEFVAVLNVADLEGKEILSKDAYFFFE